jgi:peptidoglycan/xylan/chitin deacetylase (PgdA/CDA1 family)
MKTVRAPWIARKILYPRLTWKVRGGNNQVYITFDDGPHPEITLRVLDILDEYNAKATFFCVGDNVRKYPETYSEIIRRGHAVGNHSFNHIEGWKTDDEYYFENVVMAEKYIQSKLYRPPYGKIKRSQVKELEEKYRIVMWSILSRDFDSEVSKEECFDNVKCNLQAGDIIVFHDSEKAEKNMIYSLKESLKLIKERGLVSKIIPEK